MTTKIDKLTELEEVLCNIENTFMGLLCFIKQFRISKLFSLFDHVKMKGFKASMLLLALCIYRIKGKSVWAIQKLGKNELLGADENTYYRFMNNQWVNWRKLLISFARQFNSIVSKSGEADKTVKCFVIDDTDLNKTGSKFEFISRIFNHVTKKCILGYKMLTLGLWDGKSLIAVDFSLHREKGKKGNYGLSPKERKKQFKKTRDMKSPSKERVKELDIKKGEVAVSMLKRAIKNGIMAQYVLMDSWFTNDYIIKAVRSIKKGVLHIIGMCKLDKRQYKVDGKQLNSHQIIASKNRKYGNYSRKFKSRYIPVIVDYKGEKAKLFLIQYRNSKKWTALLSTDLKLDFAKVLEIYQIRWTIEVLFKECKQYLNLGGCQNTDFDGQIADTTLVLVTHTILTLKKRFGEYETMGDLFREIQQSLIKLTLWERILKIFIKMLNRLLEIFDIEIEDVLEKLMRDKKTGGEILAILNVISKDDKIDDHSTKMAA